MDLQEVGGGGDWMELAQDRDITIVETTKFLGLIWTVTYHGSPT